MQRLLSHATFRPFIKILTSVSLLALSAALANSVLAAPQVTTAAGPTPGHIQAIVDSFRAKFGANNGAILAPFTNGFRNINWDGVPDSASHPNPMPPAFFNSTAPRGAVFNTPGAGVVTSSRGGNPSNVPPRFAGINPSYVNAFQAFSGERLFSPFDSTVVVTTFFVPSSPSTPATVSGFGAVFCDVDLPDSATIECFDAGGGSLGIFAAPVANNGLSFVGVIFDAGERVARVRVTHGTLQLGPGNVDDVAAGRDVVVADDYMYGEPQPLVTVGRLVNISARAQVGGASGALIAGFVVNGARPKGLLVRGVGPSLATLGVPGVLGNPTLAVFGANGGQLFTNDDWANATEVRQAALTVGAFALQAGSADAAAVITLAPGVYTLQVSSASGSGQALAEVYEIQ